MNDMDYLELLLRDLHFLDELIGYTIYQSLFVRSFLLLQKRTKKAGPKSMYNPISALRPD